MRFEVPQFIDIKDKIFGPFTFVQFIFVAGGGALGYLVIRLVPTFFKWPLAAIPAGFGIALAFFKYNGRPFTATVQAFAMYLFATKLYLWRQRPAKKEETMTKPPETKETEQNNKADEEEAQRLSDQRLHDLAWNLDILEHE